ncbi:reduction of Rh1 [Xylocopa sonorina]|uniref:reduction of Rh1 n=1 Tax=Xylocopa sonorina TaxID=1818115 RepID=UPI00403AD47A
MSGIPMKYPYTLSAKITRFPFEHFYFKAKRGWLLRYWTVSAILCLPLWYKIQQLSYNPENVKKWEEIRRKQFSGEMHH